MGVRLNRQQLESIRPITYSPYAGRVFEEDISDEDFTNYRDNFPLMAQTIAKMDVTSTMKERVLSASRLESLPNDLTEQLIKSGTTQYVTERLGDITYTAKYRPALRSMAHFEDMKENMFAANLADTNLNLNMYLMQQQYKASVSEADQSFITLVPLLREIITNPAELYFSEGAYRTLNLPTLQGRIPERDAFKAQLQLEPGEEEDYTRVKYGDERFDVKPNVVALMQFQESRIRATIDPLMIDIEQARTALREAREGLAVIEVQGKLNGTTAQDIEDYTATGNNAIPRSEHAPHVEFVKIIQDKWAADRVLMDTIFINVVDMSEYLTNWYRATVTPSNIQGWGIIPFPGIPGVRAVLSPFIARGYAWMCASKALLKGEGPFMEEMWREPSRRSDLGHLVDYVQFLFVTPSRYGIKLNLKSVPDNEKGDIITSVEQFEKLTEDTYAGITKKVRDKTRTLS